MAYASSKPVALGLAPSFGFGDRLGLATPGHVISLLNSCTGILPIFAQQSIREMARTNRQPTDVMSAAMAGVKEIGYLGPQGADADHLKTPEDVNRTAAAGFVFFTIDPSGDVDAAADDYSPAQVQEKFKAVAGQTPWVEKYRGKKIALTTGTTINFDELTVQKAAVKYGKAIAMAVNLAKHIEKTAKSHKQPYEIELSVDETPQPTTLAEHYIIAEQCVLAGMKLVSLAPRFIGDFEKGVDYKGDVKALSKSLADHAAIARLIGPYKLSLHSGSDKLSIYAALSRETKGLFHVKTAGTSYLEALRVVAIHDPKLFRTIIDFSRGRYDTDKATYHVSATVAGVKPQSEINDNKELEATYLGRWDRMPAGTGMSDPGRQILHCTFGSVVTHPEFGPALRNVLQSNKATYSEVLALHFGKHLEALKAGM
jgi:hypothetical protein